MGWTRCARREAGRAARRGGIVVLRMQRQAKGPGWVTASCSTPRADSACTRAASRPAASAGWRPRSGTCGLHRDGGRARPPWCRAPPSSPPPPRPPSPRRPPNASAEPPRPEDPGAARRRHCCAWAATSRGRGRGLRSRGPCTALSRSAGCSRRAPRGVLRADDVPGAQLYRDLRSRGAPSRGCSWAAGPRRRTGKPSATSRVSRRGRFRVRAGPRSMEQDGGAGPWSLRGGVVGRHCSLSCWVAATWAAPWRRVPRRGLPQGSTCDGELLACVEPAGAPAPDAADAGR